MKKLILLFAIIATTFNLSAEKQDAILMTINGKPIYQSEFEYLYNKNNTANAIEQKNYDEYLELFINFKLKVAEAEAQGLDTLAGFQRELAGYRRELAKPYLTDGELEEQLYIEAYEHFKQDCEVSHILINLPNDAAPADTLIAYNKALETIKRLEKEPFSEVADDMSDDRSVTTNHGYLGYFTALQTVWAFEKAIYTLPLNTISAPIRSNYGYHIVKVHNRRPSMGQIHAYHIMKICNDKMSQEEQNHAYEQIVAISNRLNKGEDFSKIAEEMSDDKNTAVRGGDLSWFGINRMVPEFEKAAFALETNEISKPIKSKFGWHIIKVTEKRTVEPFEKKKADIHRVMQYDNRSTAAHRSFIEKLKKEYNFTLNSNEAAKVEQLISKYSTDSLFNTNISTIGEGTIMTFANQNISTVEFAKFCANVDRSEQFTNLLTKFTDLKITNYEDTQLEKKHKAFAHLMQEYHDGILLFEISKREVWDKGTDDKEGIAEFFNIHREKYAWSQPRYKGFVIRCANKEIAKSIKREIKTMPVDSIINNITKQYNNDSTTNISIERGLWKMGDNSFVDKLGFKNKKVDMPKSEKLPIVFVVGKKLKKLPDTYTDVRGAVTADYQNHIEKLWIETLQQRYKVEINEETFKAIKEQK